VGVKDAKPNRGQAPGEWTLALRTPPSYLPAIPTATAHTNTDVFRANSFSGGLGVALVAIQCLRCGLKEVAVVAASLFAIVLRVWYGGCVPLCDTRPASQCTFCMYTVRCGLHSTHSHSVVHTTTRSYPLDTAPTHTHARHLRLGFLRGTVPSAWAV
jgi:hypothetical protein